MSSAESDEQFAWKTAFTVMSIASLAMLVLRFLINRPVFTPEFEAALVYLPTAILFGVWRRERTRMTQVAPTGS